jgi:hypothetical protein
MKNRLRMMKALAYALALMCVISGCLAFGLPYHYAATRPRTPTPSEGRVLPMANHGVVVYLTDAEDQMLFVYFLACTLSGIFSGLLLSTVRRVELKDLNPPLDRDRG